MKRISIFAFACLCAAMMKADTIKTVNGDVLNGTITLIQGEKVTIETAFAGTLKIDREKIASIAYAQAEEQTFYARPDATLRDKEEVKLSTDANGEIFLISTEDKAEALSINDVDSLWVTTADDPDFPPVKLWSFSASVGLTGHSGTTNDLSFTIAGNAVRTTERNTLKFYASYYKARSEGVETAKQFIMGLDFEDCPWERHSWYVRDELQHNPYSNYKLRNVAAAGYGFYVWNRTVEGRKSLLRLRFGLADTYTEYYTKERNSNKRVAENEVALDFGILFHYDFTCGIGWNTEITYTPIIDDLENGTIVHESKMTYTLSELALLNKHLADVAFEAGIRNEYQTRPQPGNRHSDNTWYFRLSKTW